VRLALDLLNHYITFVRFFIHSAESQTMQKIALEDAPQMIENFAEMYESLNEMAFNVDLTRALGNDMAADSLVRHTFKDRLLDVLNEEIAYEVEVCDLVWAYCSNTKIWALLDTECQKAHVVNEKHYW
jgi:hypothetical protein